MGVRWLGLSEGEGNDAPELGGGRLAFEQQGRGMRKAD